MSGAPLSTSDLFQGYKPPENVYDEFIEGNQKPRAIVKSLLNSINRIGRDEFERRWQKVQRTVQANDFAYGAFTDDDNNPRHYQLDAIPLVIASKEWNSVASGLKQRAQILELTLKDLFGEQALIKEGILPREIVFSHPGFLRAYSNPRVAIKRFLHFYAADIARAPNGDWWVLSDFTESPAGMGHALENRILISRMLPDIFHDSNIERLAPFFIAVQETLHQLAPNRKENPRTVLLSLGPTSDGYFEDAYLARYLGYTLVEGGDLAVRNNQVMLKTLGGLLPVDVVFRRQDSCDCDPLELNPTSANGISGLTHIAQRGNVGIANPLGSGLVESPIFMAFMPSLSQHFFGKELMMAGVASWWCGHPESLAHVLKNIENLNIQYAFNQVCQKTTQTESLAGQSPESLANMVRANPSLFVAQEKVLRSSVPIWNNHIQPAHTTLRAFATATKDDSFAVMEGALARTASTVELFQKSILRGEGSKDVWIQADVPVDQVTLLDEPNHAITLRRGGAELPSRAADNFFWLGRQLERAEASARLLRSTVSRLSGETRSTSGLEVPVLLRCLADQGQVEPDYVIDEMRNQLTNVETILPLSVFDESQPASLRSVLDNFFRLGSIIRDRISLDTWRIIRRIDEGFRPPRYGKPSLSDVLSLTDELITELNAFDGIVMESMTRTHSFFFLELGRRLERSLQIIQLVKNFFIPMPDVHGPLFETILEVSESLMTYRSRYLSNFQLAAVLDLLLTDETNPRSLVFQMVQLANYVDRLPRDQSQPGYSVEQRVAMSLLHSIRLLDIQKIADAHNLGDYALLTKYAKEWETELPKFSEAISLRYLVHAVHSHQLSDISPQ